MTVGDNPERILMESSGEVDADRCIEDTVKLLECSAKFLREETDCYRQASFTTFFLPRCVLCIQYIGNKLSLLSVGVTEKKK